MKRAMLVKICIILAVCCLVYGVSVKLLVSGGTDFYLVWIAGAAVLCGIAFFFSGGLWERMPHALRVCAVVLCAAFAVSLAVTEGCIVSQMHARGESGLDYIIVLGAQVREDGPSAVLKYRLDKAVAYLSENPDTVCIVSGGQGKNEPYPEAEGMAAYLEENGIDGGRILLESESKTTAENMKNSRRLIPEDATVGIVTNDFHMFRALQIAKKQGIDNPRGIAADSTAYYLPNNMLREYFAELKFLLGSF